MPQTFLTSLYIKALHRKPLRGIPLYHSGGKACCRVYEPMSLYRENYRFLYLCFGMTGIIRGLMGKGRKDNGQVV